MSNRYLQLKRIGFHGNNKLSELTFTHGVNVVCGASDTGKSFLAESIDFMLGGSELRDIPERVPYSEIQFDVDVVPDESWRFTRSSAGGKFKADDLINENSKSETLSQSHAHNKTSNMSGFLLEKIGLRGKRILKSKKKGTTQSLSFRNLARLSIIQEGEIQQSGSPFWGGQFTQKTAEMATIKLLLTGNDDSNIVESQEAGIDNTKQIELIDELLIEVRDDISDLNKEELELQEQIKLLDKTIEKSRKSLNSTQSELDAFLKQRHELLKKQKEIQQRLDEIEELLARFALLQEHYAIDIERLTAIQEGGVLFAHEEEVSCPLCGALPGKQAHDHSCDGDIGIIIRAASAEIDKIKGLKIELQETIKDLESESASQELILYRNKEAFIEVNTQINEIVAPTAAEKQASFSELIEKQSEAKRGLDLYNRAAQLESRKSQLIQEESEQQPLESIITTLPDSVMHEFSKRVSTILKAWDFPGDCNVHFDETTTDFVIDGKARGSRGKGLRAITHAAVTIALLEYCQENDLPHPGFVVLDSPLLAYFKPEGDEDKKLQGTNLKERFYSYLTNHHSTNSQVIIIENQHPPESILSKLNLTVFTGNPNEKREGFLQ